MVSLSGGFCRRVCGCGVVVWELTERFQELRVMKKTKRNKSKWGFIVLGVWVFGIMVYNLEGVFAFI